MERDCRVGAHEDGEHLDAAGRGDFEHARRLVHEAAEAAGYTVGPVYHGTNEDFAAANFVQSRVADWQRHEIDQDLDIEASIHPSLQAARQTQTTFGTRGEAEAEARLLGDTRVVPVETPSDYDFYSATGEEGAVIEPGSAQKPGLGSEASIHPQWLRSKSGVGSVPATKRGETLFKPVFACHKTQQGQEQACVGYLLVEGDKNLSVRIAASFCKFDPQVLRSDTALKARAWLRRGWQLQDGRSNKTRRVGLCAREHRVAVVGEPPSPWRGDGL